ncbi:MAG: cellulose biosynthesis cyclic di-GMP-binding regulatory protein BcsB [Hydrogenobacter thermophilus]|uniref:cellulose biosynthesis cyclic di-GMP-binding regulatory protein BcsB n=1 Tax=Hydrogenobacter thermophilus TaxID=940 RepID=UPI001C79702B|nr:cellulose biosynthesis cyclic di-GMP-binding regulatory protein BcsB [Hydrogenobacter thermophilus]QWK19757.1 MAG: cellulose biosynthesis cyclic di-GMP-binding regulatory protein BcsB [Hydrogenobacter thermophilus]
MSIVAFLLLIFLSLSSVGKTAMKVFTFQELNLLSEDLLLKGVNPKYEFYIPTLTQLSEGKLTLKLRVSPYLREDSTITVLVDDIPYQTFKVNNLPPEIVIPFKRKGYRNFLKVSLLGNLRISNNICEDVFSDKIWMVLQKDSQVEFNYREFSNIREFLIDYNNAYCINSSQLIPFVYHLCKQSPVPCQVKYQVSQDMACKIIEPAQNNTLELRKDVLYVPWQASIAFERGIFPSLLLESPQDIKAVEREPEEVRREVSLKELGLSTVSVEGVGNLNYTIPLDLSRIGGLPDRLYFRLFISHTPVHKKDSMELRVYLNGRMISAYPLEGSGKNSFEIEIPTDQLGYGVNYIGINLVNFTSADNCFGAVSHSVLTVFENSYFYWNNLRNRPETISDFFRILHGRVALLLKDEHFNAFATTLISQLGVYKKNIELIDINPPDLSKYDFVISFETPKDTQGKIIDLSKGDFEIINSLTNRSIFISGPREPFAVLMVQEVDQKPALIFSYYPSPSGIEPLFRYRFSDMLELFGNVGIVTNDFASAYEVGKKLRIEYKYEKGLSYYWNKYRLWIVLLLFVPATAFLAYVYRKLTRRTQV